MDQRSRIGYELPDHSVMSICCDWDGYIEHNGRILVEDYDDRDDVEELIRGGNLSSLETILTWDSVPLKNEVGDCIPDEDDSISYSHTRNAQPLYHAERGHDPGARQTSLETFLSGESGEKFAYLFDLNDTWKAWQIGDGSPTPLHIPGYTFDE